MDALADKIEAALKAQSLVEGGVLRARRRDKYLEMGKLGL